MAPATLVVSDNPALYIVQRMFEPRDYSLVVFLSKVGLFAIATFQGGAFVGKL